MEPHALFTGTTAWEYDLGTSRVDNYYQARQCVDCGRQVSNGHIRCRPCNAKLKKQVAAPIPAARYLNAIPDGYELIWYPKMARSRIGKQLVRRHLRRRLMRYFARQKPTPKARIIHPDVHAFWSQAND